MKQLAKNLFITFIIAILVTSAFAAIYYAVLQKGDNYQQALPHIVSGVFFLNVILLVMTLPALFLSFANYWSNVTVRALLYFCGPVCYIIAVFNMRLKPRDTLIYLVAGVIFTLIHGWFYYKINRNKA